MSDKIKDGGAADWPDCPLCGHRLEFLLADQVLTIRSLCEMGIAHARIAKIFGISAPFVWKIQRRLKWRHI